MPKLDYLIEELVTANRILAREGSSMASAMSACAIPTTRSAICCRARARPTASRPTTSWSSRSRASRSTPKAARPISSASSMARSTRRGRTCIRWCTTIQRSVIPFGVTSNKLKPLLHMGAISATRCRSGTRTTSSATPRCWSRTWRWAAISPRRWAAGRTALMRGHGATVAGAQYPARGVHLGLSRGQRQAADAGHGYGRHQVPHPRRGRQVIERTGPYSINRAWENWCRRAGRPSDGPGVQRAMRATLTGVMLSRGADVLYGLRQNLADAQRCRRGQRVPWLRRLMPAGRRRCRRARAPRGRPFWSSSDIVKRFETPDGVAYRRRSCLAGGRAGRVRRRHRPFGLRQVDAVQHHRRPARRL